MKKLFFGLMTAALVSLSSFKSVDSNDLILKECTYNMYSASGQYLGTHTISMFEFADCGSIYARAMAVKIWNDNH